MSKKNYQVQIEERYCKGCGLCVKFCPSAVLAMVSQKAKVVDGEKCVGCKACEIRCPDFAVNVEAID